MATKSETRTIDWHGQSGRTYKHWIYPLPPNFKPEPGNYVFAKETNPAHGSRYTSDRQTISVNGSMHTTRLLVFSGMAPRIFMFTRTLMEN